MARYMPDQPIEIAEPCHAEWDNMDGSARVRHCAACDRDVHNTAALTPAQTTALLAQPGPPPCLRIARYDDGSMLVAAEARAHAPYGMLAAAAMTTLVSITTACASAQTVGKVTMGTPPVARSSYSGQVVNSDGKPAPEAHVYLLRTVNGKNERVEVTSDAHGSFRLEASPGEWQIGAYGSTGPFSAREQSLTLHAGDQKAVKPVQLEVSNITMGLIAPPVKPLPTTKPLPITRPHAATKPATGRKAEVQPAPLLGRTARP